MVLRGGGHGGWLDDKISALMNGHIAHRAWETCLPCHHVKTPPEDAVFEAESEHTTDIESAGALVLCFLAFRAMSNPFMLLTNVLV